MMPVLYLVPKPQGRLSVQALTPVYLSPSLASPSLATVSSFSVPGVGAPAHDTKVPQWPMLPGNSEEQGSECQIIYPVT